VLLPDRIRSVCGLCYAFADNHSVALRVGRMGCGCPSSCWWHPVLAPAKSRHLAAEEGWLPSQGARRGRQREEAGWGVAGLCLGPSGPAGVALPARGLPGLGPAVPSRQLLLVASLRCVALHCIALHSLHCIAGQLGWPATLQRNLPVHEANQCSQAWLPGSSEANCPVRQPSRPGCQRNPGVGEQSPAPDHPASAGPNPTGPSRGERPGSRIANPPWQWRSTTISRSCRAVRKIGSCTVWERRLDVQRSSCCAEGIGRDSGVARSVQGS
jgi:hypothetical protein